MRVLHVAECLVGGVRTAIAGYIQATPDLEHVGLVSSRRDNNLSIGRLDGASALFPLAPNHARAVRQVSDVAKEVKADVIHAHSSFAGAYSRAHLGRPAAPVVYTPHALAYGRPDFAPAKRAVYRVVESVLSRRTSVFAGCSVHESQLLNELNSTVPVVTIPNSLPPDHPAHTITWTPPERHVVGMVGRINDYRNPGLFIEAARLVQRQRDDVSFVWIGDGEDDQREALRRAGVEVTGWLDGADLQSRISGLSALLYTSAWDGFPMVILEAITSAVPTFVSDIAPLRECPADARFKDADEASRLVLEHLSNPAPLAPSWRPVLEAHAFERQREALRHAYDLAAGR